MVFSIEVGDEKRDVKATKDGVAKAEDPHETVLDGDETRTRRDKKLTNFTKRPVFRSLDPLEEK